MEAYRPRRGVADLYDCNADTDLMVSPRRSAPNPVLSRRSSIMRSRRRSQPERGITVSRSAAAGMLVEQLTERLGDSIKKEETREVRMDGVIAKHIAVVFVIAVLAVLVQVLVFMQLTARGKDCWVDHAMVQGEFCKLLIRSGVAEARRVLTEKEYPADELQSVIAALEEFHELGFTNRLPSFNLTRVCGDKNHRKRALKCSDLTATHLSLFEEILAFHPAKRDSSDAILAMLRELEELTRKYSGCWADIGERVLQAGQASTSRLHLVFGFVLLLTIVVLVVEVIAIFVPTVRTAEKDFREALELERSQILEEMSTLRVKEQLLHTANALMSEMSLRPLLHLVMRTACDLIDGDACCLYLCERNREGVQFWSRDIVRRSADGLSVHSLPMETPLQMDIESTQLLRQCYEQRESVRVSDLQTDPRFHRDKALVSGCDSFHEVHNNARSALLCPLVKDGSVQGILVVYAIEEDRSYSLQDVTLLEMYSSQATVAIHNASLYTEKVLLERHLETVLGSITDTVMAFDESTALITTNRVTSISDIFGVSLDADGEVTVADVFSRTQGSGQVMRDIQRVYASGSPVLATDLQLVDPLGRPVHVSYTVSPLISGGVVLCLDDISKEQRIKLMLSRYLTPVLADQLLDMGEARLGGCKQTVTTVFGDVKGFTALCEGMSPEDVVELLNENFSAAVPCVLERHGVLDKYIGDALMATFGVPFPTDDDATNACHAALAMLNACAQVARARREVDPSAVVYDMCFGLNTGEAISGNIGCDTRLEFTVVGDSVNLASRVEGLTRMYGVSIMVTENTVESVKPGLFAFRRLDRVRVKGKQEPVVVFELVCEMQDLDAHMRGVITCYEASLEKFFARDIRGALEGFSKFRDVDTPCAVMADRCKEALDSGDASTMDTCRRLTEK